MLSMWTNMWCLHGPSWLRSTARYSISKKYWPSWFRQPPSMFWFFLHCILGAGVMVSENDSKTFLCGGRSDSAENGFLCVLVGAKTACPGAVATTPSLAVAFCGLPQYSCVCIYTRLSHGVLGIACSSEVIWALGSPAHLP